MQKRRFSAEQIIGVLKQAELVVTQLCSPPVTDVRAVPELERQLHNREESLSAVETRHRISRRQKTQCFDIPFETRRVTNPIDFGLLEYLRQTSQLKANTWATAVTGATRAWGIWHSDNDACSRIVVRIAYLLQSI